jgi:hypothetical protein
MGTLNDRIREAEQQRRADLRRLDPPVAFRPRWLKRLTDKDMTSSVLYNGAHTPAGDGGAA